MKLTPNFSLEEFTRSEEAKRRAIDNTPGPEHLANLRITAFGMEMVRRVLGGRPILITSGYRSPALNTAVGGTETSAHGLGFAADFTVEGLTPILAARMIEKAMPYDQLIVETSRHIVHISFDPRMRQQALTQRAGPGTPIEQGLNY